MEEENGSEKELGAGLSRSKTHQLPEESEKNGGARREVIEIKERSFEDVLKEANNFGPYQKWQLFLLSLTVIPISFSFMSIPLLAGVPKYRCAVPEVDALTNVSLSKRLNATLPLDDDAHLSHDDHLVGPTYSNCLMYLRDYTNVTAADLDVILDELNYTQAPQIGCVSGWEYDKEYFKSTIVTEFDLVCDNKVLITVIESMYEAGKIAGTLIFGTLSDRYGRRPILLATLCLLFITSTALAFSPDVIFFTIFRFFQAAACVFLLSFVLMNELCGPSWRNIVSQWFEVMWALCYMALAGIGYALRDWFHIQLVIAASALPFFVFYWLVPESPRWLYSINRREEGDRIMKGIFERNNRVFPKNVDVVVTKQKPGTMIDLFKTPTLRKWTVVIYYLWFANSMVYYGLVLGTGDLGGSPYTNFLISAAVEVPAYIVCLLVLQWCGRRFPLAGSQALAGIALLCIMIVPHENDTAVTALAQTGKFCISFSYAAVFLYVIEIFPTAVRSIGLGSSAMAANIGGVIAPFIGDLGKFTSFTTLPYLVFGTVALAAGILTLLLPETHNKDLPQTVEECEALAKKKNNTNEISLYTGHTNPQPVNDQEDSRL